MSGIKTKKLVALAVAEAEYRLVKKILTTANAECKKSRTIETSICVGFIKCAEPIVKAKEKRAFK